MDRRQFLGLGIAGAGAVTGAVTVPLALRAEAETAAAAAPVRLSGVGYTAKFTRPLTRPPQVLLGGSRNSVTIDVVQFTQPVLTGYPATTLYGYAVSGQAATWPGPTIQTATDQAINITWRNRLPTGAVALKDGGHLLPLDGTLLDDLLNALPAGQKPTVTHVHGAHVDSASDGYPEAWYTQSGIRGPHWRQAVSTYDNSQVGGTLWYHDHTMGITRLNSYAGMAGAYLIRDTVEARLIAGRVLPDPLLERELVLQDRAFTDDGQLLLPVGNEPPNGIQLGIYGDFVMINGVAWPVFDVEPRKYRFRLVNGSDSRFYVLQLSTGQDLLVTGTELGLLPKATAAKRLPVGPGERYDFVLDFTGLAAGTEVTLENGALDGPLNGFKLADGTVTNNPNDLSTGFGAPANPESTGKLMRFRVSKALSGIPVATVKAGTTLGPALPKLTATRTRKVMAFAGTDGLGRSTEMLGTLETGTEMWMDPATEVIRKGTTEIWEIHNTGPVAHTVHLHLVNFQVLSRAPFTYTAEPKEMMDGWAGAKITVTGTGTQRGPEPYEQGRKDTVICWPGEITRVAARFDRAGDYVWHCHILHHEDHDMMRPIRITS